MRIMRCELCKKPCMLTLLDDIEILHCPATGRPAEWRQVNSTKDGRLTEG
ncbi:MAG: hypothetical protein GYA23_05355 [Methanomicrobiales archaeon]|nr:hypothetical protein [Methanomicrobiales archaeon]